MITIIKLIYMKTIFKQIISITLIAMILGLFNNYFITKHSVSLIKQERTASMVLEGDFSIPDLMTEPQIVKTDFVKYHFDNNSATIIDARDQNQYEDLHIKGSINIPYNIYEDSEILYDIPIEGVYIIYCNGGECTLSIDLAYVMFDEFDFESVFVYEEGIPIWESSGYPLNSNMNGNKIVIDDDGDLDKSSILKWITILLSGLFYLNFIIKTIKDNKKSLTKIVKTIFIISFRLVLGYIFIYASASKIINPLEFSNQIDLYDATPIIFNNMIALIIPWIELLIGLGLILNRKIKGSIVLSFILLIVFIILLSQAYYRGISLDCGCFGTGEIRTDIELSADMLKRIWEDIIFLCMTIYLYFIYVFNKREYAN